MPFVREMFGELPAAGKLWLYTGVVTLACAALMSFGFGYEISGKHAFFLACLTVIAAFLPEAAYAQFEKGRWGVCIVLALIAVPTLMIEFYTHMGYTAGIRGSNIETASVQNTKWTGVQKTVKEDETNLAMWEKRLSDLENANGWVATVTADALRAKLASANLAIDLEAKRGGCKGKCLARTQERDEIASKIALAEEKTDLTNKIAATKKVLETARSKAADTEFKSSAVVHQKNSLAKMVALFTTPDMKPTDLMSEGAQESVNLAMALAGTGLPALAFFVAGLYRRPETDTSEIKRAMSSPFRIDYNAFCNTRGVKPVRLAAA